MDLSALESSVKALENSLDSIESRLTLFTFLDRYASASGEFCSRSATSGSDLEPDFGKELVQVISDALVEPIQLRPPLLLKLAIARNRLKEPGGEGGVNALEEFQEDHADGVAFAREPVAPRAFNLLNEPFGTKLRDVVAK